MGQITPELAASVVKDYLLPMFDNKKKKQHIKTQSNGVYSELKLSEKLMLQIEDLKNERLDLLTQREKLEFKVIDLQKQMKSMEQLMNSLKIKMKKQGMYLESSKELVKSHKLDFQRFFDQIGVMRNLLQLNDHTRQQLSSGYVESKLAQETLQNNLFKLHQEFRLTQTQNEVMGEQLVRLYDAFENIADIETIKTKFELDKKTFQEERQEKTKQIEDMQKELGKLNQENGDLKEYLNWTISQKKKITEDKEKNIKDLKDKNNQMEQELKSSELKRQLLEEDQQKQEKQIQIITNEREKLKQKIQKLKRRRNVDLNQKICKNCGKEYLENENFNWSCRTHRSEFGGEMWWCCGKTKKDAPGCKFSKHECKDDEEEDKDKEEDDKIRHKYIRCFCCKELGHHTDDCL